MSHAEPLVFLDSSSGEPTLSDACAAWINAQKSGWGDPLGLHRPGRLAAQALDRARETVATAVGARSDEVVFTSSGSHSAYAAIAGLARGRRRNGARVVTTAIDHSSVLEAAADPGSPDRVGVDRQGRLDLGAWATAVSEPGTALACLQVANHEVGTRQPVAEAIAHANSVGVPVVLDATAALGRIDLTRIGGWSILTGWAGAYGGPSSVGIMVIRKGTRWRAPYPTDDYQDGRWPGPPDVPAIHAAAVGLDTCLRGSGAIGERQRVLVDRLRTEILTRIRDVDIAGDPINRVPHLLTFSALYVDGEALTLELDRAGFAVASGSACSSRSEQPSHVLAAMGALTHGNVRIGLTRATTGDEVQRFVEVLPTIVTELRSRVGIR